MAKIFSVFGRAGLTRVFDPMARALLRVGVSPDAVTVAGTFGVIIGAVGFAARGQLVPAVVIVTLCAFTDMLDGSMARQSGRVGRFGAFLDSTMDRVADGAVFGAVAYWLGTQGRHWAAAAALICLVTGQIVSYAKARAEGLGMTANVGVAERFERLLLVGLGGLAGGFGLRDGLDGAPWGVAGLSGVTIGPRTALVYQQGRGAQPRNRPQSGKPPG